jgi:hypothetical protein
MIVDVMSRPESSMKTRTLPIIDPPSASTLVSVPPQKQRREA